MHLTPWFFVPCRVKEIIHKNDGKEKVCDERDGWCLPHTADELRNIISGLILKHIQVKPPGKMQHLHWHTESKLCILLILCGFVVASSTPKTRRARPKTPVDSGEDEDDDDDDDEDYKPSDESDNEMETEIADYM